MEVLTKMIRDDNKRDRNKTLRSPIIFFYKLYDLFTLDPK